MSVPCVCVNTHSRQALGLSKVLFHLSEYEDMDELNEAIKARIELADFDEYIYSYYEIPRRLQDKWKLHVELFEYKEGLEMCKPSEEDAFLVFCDYFGVYSYEKFRYSYIGTSRPDDYDEGVRLLEDEPWLNKCPAYLQPYLPALYESYGEDNSEVEEMDGYYFYDID